MPTRREELSVIRLQGHCVRIGRTPDTGPIFYLGTFEHSHGVFHTRNVHNGITGTMSARDLATYIAEGIAHPSKVRGVIYHA